HSFANHTHHCGAIAGNAHHPHRFRDSCRSGRQRLRREPRKGDCAARRPGRRLVQPGNGVLFRILPEAFYAAAASFGVVAITAPVHDMAELESAIAALALEPNGGLVVPPDPFTVAHSAEIISLAARYRLPAVYPARFFAELGGLLSYGNDVNDNF